MPRVWNPAPIDIGGAMGIIESVDVESKRGHLTRVTMAFLITPGTTFDVEKLFKSPEVTKVINDEIQKQARQFNFDA